MNDDELTAVGESVTCIHTATPVERIVTRGHAVRTRRRIPGVAAALAVVAGVAVAMIALVPASHQASKQPGAQLAAWTVTRQPDGDVRVSIRQLHDAARLQSRLRADGIPASVTYFGHANPACRAYEHVPPPRWLAGSKHVPVAVIARVIARTTHGVIRLAPGYPPAQTTNHFLIVSSALPPKVGVQISAEVTSARVALSFGLVHASAQCAGS
jgi:hypothetical protein